MNDARAARIIPSPQWLSMESITIKFPDDSSVHRTFQRWEQNGVLDGIWAALVEECELGGVNWQWQSGCSNG